MAFLDYAGLSRFKAKIQTLLDGKKNTQTAVSSPSASGTDGAFIDTISQNAQGVITPTRKTVRTMGAASSSAAGTTGLVPAPASGKQASFLRGDATWVVPTDTKNTAGSTDISSKLFRRLPADEDVGRALLAPAFQTDIHEWGIVGSHSHNPHGIVMLAMQ